MNSQLLQELITQNSRVILPDFGAFLVKDDGSNIFKPENVSFSPFLKYNDGMVEDWLMVKLGVPKVDAIKQLDSFVDSIRNALKEKGEFPLGNIGVLTKDASNTVHFAKGKEVKTSSTTPPKDVAPSDSAALKTPKSKSVSVSKAKPTAKVEPKQPEKPQVEKQPTPPEPLKEEPKATDDIIEKIEVPKDTAAQKPTQPPVAQVKPQIVNKPTPKVVATKKSSGTLKAILVGLLLGLFVVAGLIGVFFYLGNNPFTYEKEKLRSLTEPAKQETPVADEEEKKSTTEETVTPKGRFDEEYEQMSKTISSQDPTPAAGTQQPSRAISHSDPQDPAPMPTPSSTGNFHIIVGSFRNVEYAEQYSNTMIQSGYSSTVIAQPSGMHAVTLGSYQSRAEAQRAMDVFKNQHPNVWILNQ